MNEAADTDPLPSPLVQAAIATKEMYESLVAAGFTEKQALTIVSRVLLGKQSDE
jgi:hypothetical protein